METFILLIILLALAVLSFYLGFIYKRHFVQSDFFGVFNRRKAQTGFFVFLFLVGLTAYAIWNETQSSVELSEYIKPYNNIKF